MKSFTFFCSLIFTISTFAQLPPEKPLYPEGLKNNPITHPHEEMYVDSFVHPKSLTGLNRVYSYVSEPTYMIFPANKKNDKKVGLVIYPGGGLRNVWLDKEGTDIALWLSERGITCMVVKYRTNRRNQDGKFEIDFKKFENAIYQDGRTSMLTMKSLADSLGFDKNNIGMMGFSAGGWVAERMVFKYYKGEYDWNPSFVALIYHGNNIKFLNKVKHIEKLPPFFMAIAKDDAKLPLEKIMPYLKKISSDVKGSELNIYDDGDHGFGLAYDENSSVFVWKNDFLKWLDGLD